MIDVTIIGCGGIGGFLIPLVCQSMASITMECLNTTVVQELLDNEGDVLYPCLFNSLVLVDGDDFDPHNAVRQVAGAGSKLAVQMNLVNNMKTEDIDPTSKIRDTMLRETWLRMVDIKGYNTYIKPENIAEIIPQNKTANYDELLSMFKGKEIDSAIHRLFRYLAHSSIIDRYCRGAGWSRPETRQSFPFVFLCVDNHKTRYEVQKYMETFADCVLINGGNSKTSGNVTVYQKRDNNALDPALYEIYPEIANGESKRPDEVHCGEVSRQNDQIAFVNSMIAAKMCDMMRKLICDGLEVRQRDGTFKRKNEIVIDNDNDVMMPLYHKVK